MSNEFSPEIEELRKELSLGKKKLTNFLVDECQNLSLEEIIEKIGAKYGPTVEFGKKEEIEVPGESGDSGAVQQATEGNDLDRADEGKDTADEMAERGSSEVVNAVSVSSQLKVDKNELKDQSLVFDPITGKNV